MAEYVEKSAIMDALNKLCDRVCVYSKKQRDVMCDACPLGHAFDTIDEMEASKIESDFKEYAMRQIKGEQGVTGPYACAYCKNRNPGWVGCYVMECNGISAWEYGKPEEDS